MFHKLIKSAALALTLCSTLYGAVAQEQRVTEPYTRVVALQPVQSVFGSQTILQTRDGIQWQLDEQRSIGAVQDWRLNDRIVLYPVTRKNCFFSSKNSFAMKNLETGSLAFVKLSDGPAYEKSRTRWISDVDRSTRRFAVLSGNNNVAYYKVFEGDITEFFRWRINDFIIIGSNKTPDAQMECPCSRICVNTRTQTYIRVELIKN
jgi:hypothetical protein